MIIIEADKYEGNVVNDSNEIKFIKLESFYKRSTILYIYGYSLFEHYPTYRIISYHLYNFDLYNSELRIGFKSDNILRSIQIK
jgi:hypothetical protein